MGDELKLLNDVYLEVVTAMRNARRANEELTPEDVRDYIRTRTGQPYDTLQQVIERARQIESAPDVAGGVAMAALHGASFGFLDEAVGLISQDARDELRRQRTAFRGEHPVASLAGEVAGGLLVPGLASIQALRGGATFGRAAAVGATVGAGEGAIVGAGEADTEDWRGRVAPAVTGAAIGGVAGGLLGGGIHAGRGAWRAITGRTGRSVTEEARAVAQDIAGQSPRGIEGVLQDFERMQRLTPESILADVPEMRPVARAAAVSSPEARAIAQEVLPPRIRAARERVEQKLLTGIGETDVPSTMQRQARLRQRFQQGSQAYQELINTVPNVSGEDVKLAMRNDVVVDAWQAANRIAKRSGEPLIEVVKRQGDEVVFTGANPDFRTLQAIKQQLDDEVGHLYSLRRPNEARSVANVRDDFYGVVLEEVSGYGPAQRGWMEMIEEERAITAGMDFLRKKPREIVAEIQSLKTPGAQTAYREAAIESISDKLRGQVRRGDVSRIFDSADMEERLHLLFPDDVSFQRFLDELDIEREMSATASQLLGGSATAESLNLAQRLRRGGAGAEFLQRASIIPVAPGIGLSRIAADVQASRLGRQAERRAREVGGVLGSSLMGRGDISARNLLTGALGSTAPGLFTDYAFRSPRSLLLAMRGQ